MLTAYRLTSDGIIILSWSCSWCGIMSKFRAISWRVLLAALSTTLWTWNR